MKWSHLLCAIWIPEVSLGNTTFQEPVQDVEKVPKTRWKLVSSHRFKAPVRSKLTPNVDMLYMQAKDGSVYSMWPQILL
jgi:hypothetical protein